MSVQPEFRIKEQVWSGTTMLYITPPMRSLVVEVDTSSEVVGKTLQAAVNDVLERAPYFGDAFVEREGSFYYAENPLPFEVAEGSLRAVGGPETNWHNLDVTYEGSTISFSMFHAFCDGLGLNHFIEAVLNRYFSRKDGVDYPADGLRVPGQPTLEGEEADGIIQLEPTELTPEIAAALAVRNTDSYRLPEGEQGHLDHMHFMTVHVPEDALLDFVRSCGSSPAPALLALMAETVFTVHPEADKPLKGIIPTSTRKALNVPNTFKNAASVAFICFDPTNGASFAERAAAARADLRKQNAPELIRFTNGGLHALIESTKEATTYAQKQAVLNTGADINPSISVDYVGGLRTEGFEDQLVELRYLATPMDGPANAITLFVTATAGRFDLAFARDFTTDVYDKAFLAQLDKYNLPYELGGEYSFCPPRIGLIPALGLA